MILHPLPSENYNDEEKREAPIDIVPDTLLTKFFLEVQSLTVLVLHFFREVLKPPYEFNELLKQSFLIGYKTFPLVAITGFIIGLVLTIQTGPTLAKFGAESWLPAMVAVSIIREIGPVITSLIFAGKVGSGIGAELASMKVTEQIDAMQVSGTNPFKFLVVTRILSATLMLPILVILSDACGLFGSYIAVNLNGSVSTYLFFSRYFKVFNSLTCCRHSLKPSSLDLRSGLLDATKVTSQIKVRRA